jgi:5-methylcytosine-specific restriction endonuclease McrA
MDPILPDSKACTKCLVEKPLDEFNKRSLSPDGYVPNCKACCVLYRKDYRAANIEALTERDALYYKNNKEAIARTTKIYSENNKEALAAYKKTWAEENAEEIAVKHALYQKQNKEAIATQRAAYYKQNLEEISAKARIWRSKNVEAIAASKRGYSSLYPERLAESSRRRRARKLGNGSEPYTVDEMLLLYGTDCHICSEPIDLEAARRAGQEGWQFSLHVDHFQPLSKGGPDSLANVRPAHGLCNLKKHDTWDDGS